MSIYSDNILKISSLTNFFQGDLYIERQIRQKNKNQAHDQPMTGQYEAKIGQ